MSARRIIVERPIADEFSARLAAKTAGLKLGDPQEHDTIIGPLITPSRLETVKRRVDEAVASGARVLAGGEAVGSLLPGDAGQRRPGRHRARPAGDVRPGGRHRCRRQPRRGRRAANAHRLRPGRRASSRATPTAASRSPQRSQAGIVHVNDQPVHDEPQMPFGGVKDSGWGRFGGHVRDGRVHRAALDHGAERHEPVPVLRPRWLTIVSLSEAVCRARPRRRHGRARGVHAPDPARRRARARPPAAARPHAWSG